MALLLVNVDLDEFVMLRVDSDVVKDVDLEEELVVLFMDSALTEEMKLVVPVACEAADKAELKEDEMTILLKGSELIDELEVDLDVLLEDSELIDELEVAALDKLDLGDSVVEL